MTVIRFDPKPHQREAWEAIEDGAQRIVLAWHRRAGKDEVCLAGTRLRAVQKAADYLHLLPEQEQARKAIWNARNPHTGNRRLNDIFPDVLVDRYQDQQMRLELINGAAWQVWGSNRYDSLVGGSAHGVVFSEYQNSDPAAAAYIRPMIVENDGWMMFNGTARGVNHFKRLIDEASGWDGWFVQILRADQTGVFTDEALRKEEREYVAEHGEDFGKALFRQEYLMDFTSAVIGSIFGPELTEAERDERVGWFPYDDSKPVFLAFDIGIDDETFIWHVQGSNQAPVIVGCSHGRHKSAAEFVGELRPKYHDITHAILPHDAANRTAAHGVDGSYESAIKALGIKPIVLKNEGQANYINGANLGRSLLRRARIHRPECSYGLQVLAQFRQKYDMSAKTLTQGYEHDWASHGGTAWMHLARGFHQIPDGLKKPRIKRRERGHFDVLNYRHHA